MTNDDKKEAYEALRNIEKEVADLHNTLEYWIEKLLNDIDWKDDDE